MNEQFGNVVYPVIQKALDLKDRLDRGESADFDAEHRRLLEQIRADGEARRLSDYSGDSGAFLGARYALACWVDELMIVHTPSPWSERWAGAVLEYALFGTRDRAFKFWDQLRIALKRPDAPRAAVAPGPDALETFFLCIVLGYRGRHRDDPAEVRAYVEEIRPQFGKVTPWIPPRDLGVVTNVAPLQGRQSLLRVLWVRGMVALGLLLASLILGIVWLASASE
jgi:type VI secretion system protein ImpK